MGSVANCEADCPKSEHADEGCVKAGRGRSALDTPEPGRYGPRRTSARRSLLSFPTLTTTRDGVAGVPPASSRAGKPAGDPDARRAFGDPLSTRRRNGCLPE